mmetsp:Transcript_2219/g.2995  ORF Transcript_2219/g.2995 Transcript_2219/m.2995 type:complete len:652 (+) Transcript_2219:116-2071(+)
MNLKHAFVFSIAFTCLAPNIFAASAAQGGAVLADSEDSRYQSTPHASTSRKSVSTIANDNRILHDDHGDAGELTMLQELKAIPALDKSRCRDSPLILLLETTGGSKIPFACKSMLKSNNTSCSASGVLASHCPKACGMCQLYKCSDSKGTFLMQNGCDRDCSWLQGSSERRKRIECKRGAVAKTCRATCNFCDSDDTAVTNKPSTELGAVPSAVPSFDPSLVPSAVPSNKPSLVPTNAPSVQLSNPPSRELSLVPSFDPSYSSPRPSTLMWSQLYNDLTGEASGDEFGYASAISADGSRLIAGAYGHSGYTGQVRVYRDTGDSWEQVHAPLNGDANNDRFGSAVGLSEDGMLIIVSAVNSNKVKVFRDNGLWSWEQFGQDLIVSKGFGNFGPAVGMSSKGLRIIIGDWSDKSDTGRVDTGRVYVLDYDGTTWGNVYQTDLSGTSGSQFGRAVGISADGFRIIISAPWEYVNGIFRTGQTKVFEDTGSSWEQLGQDLNGSAAGDLSGYSVAMAGNGERVVIGTPKHDENGKNSGQVKVFEYNSQGEWVHVHDRNFNGNGANDELGRSVGISHDGTKIVMGSYENGDIFNSSGQVQVFKDNGTAWVQVGDDINGEAFYGRFGDSTGITGDGSRIVASAYGSNSDTGKVQVFEK